MTDLISEARALIADLNQSAQMPVVIGRLADTLEAVAKALEQAITYIELAYDENGGEEAAEAKYDLETSRAALDRVRKG